MYARGVRRTTLRAKGQLTLPDEIRKAAHLEEGDLLEAEITADGILLRPQKVVDATRAGYWTPAVPEDDPVAGTQADAVRMEALAAGEEFVETLRARARSRRTGSS